MKNKEHYWEHAIYSLFQSLMGNSNLAHTVTIIPFQNTVPNRKENLRKISPRRNLFPPKSSVAAVTLTAAALLSHCKAAALQILMYLLWFVRWNIVHKCENCLCKYTCAYMGVLTRITMTKIQPTHLSENVLLKFLMCTPSRWMNKVRKNSIKILSLAWCFIIW